MEEKVVIGLDSSTTGTKAIAFDKEGGIITQANQSIPLFSPKQNHYEQNAADWWSSSKNVLQQITKQIDPKKITALSISNQRETFVALDENGNSLRAAIIWLDERCKGEVEEFSKIIGQKKIHRITGKPHDFAPVVYRLAWMKKHEPDLFGQISMICDVHTWLVWKLTDTFKTSRASADPFGMYDLTKMNWSDKILDALSLTKEQLPEVLPPGSIIGKITKEAAQETGLSQNTLIVAGGGDGQAAGLGANALTSKRAYLNLGTAVVMGVFGKNYKTNNAFRTMTACSENGYYFESSLRAGTFSIDWFIKNILKIDPKSQTEIYNILEDEARQVPFGSEGLFFLPYLSGVMNPYWNTNAKGSFIGLSSSHHRGHLYRSILEGIAFEQLLALNSIEKSLESKIRELIVIGGGAGNNFWCQILADITGKNICLPRNSEASSLGVGISAAVGAGWYKTFKMAAQKMTGIERIIKPNSKNHKTSSTLFNRYKEIYPALNRIK